MQPMPRFAVLAILALSSCARPSTDIRKAPETALSPTSSAMATSSEQEPPLVTHIYDHIGARISIDARPATMISQHMGGGSPGKTSFYLEDLGDGGDFVAYGATKPNCPGVIRLIGTVIVISGGGKEGQKMSDPYHEPQLDVESWRCL